MRSMSNRSKCLQGIYSQDVNWRLWNYFIHLQTVSCSGLRNVKRFVMIFLSGASET